MIVTKAEPCVHAHGLHTMAHTQSTEAHTKATQDPCKLQWPRAPHMHLHGLDSSVLAIKSSSTTGGEEL